LNKASPFQRWIDETVFDLGRQMRWSYLPPLMVYLAAGVSGLTAIVGTFFVKEYLGLSAAFLAGLGFWAGIPWALKMPLGHLVDLIWRWKALLVYVGAGLIAVSLGIMYGLIAHTGAMAVIMPVESWFVLSVLLSPTGYVVQDVVADAMTVEAVPVTDLSGQPFPEDQVKRMHTTMQTLGRFAIIGGSMLVAILNISKFSGVDTMSAAEKSAIYADIYLMALAIPLISVLGVISGSFALRRRAKRMREEGVEREQIDDLLFAGQEQTRPNWWILGGTVVFAAFTLTVGLNDVPYAQEIIFVGSLGIVLDVLGFDQQFLSVLSLITAGLALAGMVVLRPLMATRSIAYVVILLTLASGFLSLPNIGLYYGLHERTARLTAGIVDAHFIAILDTALESPLGQIAMIPMLAWIAKNAPPHLKATFFAVMASFTNLALSASSLLTKYMNQMFLVSREVRDRTTGAITTPADYGDLGWLLISVSLIGLLVPLGVIFMIQRSRFKTRQ
jgi:hypothetical protein